MAPTKLPTIHCTMNKYICIRQILDPDGTAWIFEFEFNIPDRFLDTNLVFHKEDEIKYEYRIILSFLNFMDLDFLYQFQMLFS